METIKKIKVIWIFILGAMLLVGCDESPTAGLSSLKLSSEELGTKEHISRFINNISSDVNTINGQLSKATKAKEQRNFGIADKHHKKANKVLYKWRNFIFSYARRGQIYTVYPESMKRMEIARNNLLGLYKELPNEGEMSDEQLNKILTSLRSFVAADSEFYSSVTSRKSNPDLINPKFTLEFELRPFPFKIEILNGEFKIKQSFSIKTITGSLVMSNSGTRTGITKIILVHKGRAKVYAVGNRKLSFDVPASRIDIDGKTMTITTL